MPSSIQQLVMAMLAVASAAVIAAPVNGQQDGLTDGQTIHIPDRTSAFAPANSDAVYRSVINVADLPRPVVQHSANANALRSAPPDHAQNPIALVSYQEAVSETEGNRPPDLGGLSWMEDPVFAFGGLFPVNNQAFDRWKLRHLKDSLEQLSLQIESVDDIPKEALEISARAHEWCLGGESNLDQIETFQKEIKNVPVLMKQLQEAMSQPLPDPPAELDDRVSLETQQSLLQDQLTHESRLRKETRAAEARIAARTQQFSKFASSD